MSTFTVWKYDDAEGAEHAASIVRRAADDGLVRILDHAVVSWPPGADRPTTTHKHDDTWRGAGWGAVWGLLFGAMFLVPVVGLAAGAAGGALVKVKEGLGVTDQQLERIRDEITEGTSALFLVTDHGDLDRLGERMRGVHARLLDTNLTRAEKSLLTETFGGA